MKREFTKLMAALALLVFMTPSLAGWGQTTVEVGLSDGQFDTDHITWVCANNGISIQQLKGNSSTAVNSSYISAPRVYKGHILAFEGSSNCMITNIAITVSGTYYGNSMTAGTVVNGNVVTDNTDDVARSWASTSDGTHQISSVSENGLPAIYIQNVASTNVQLRPTAISITYIASGTPTPITYTVTYKANGGTGDEYAVADIEFGATHTVLGIDVVGFTAPENKTFVTWKDDNDNEYAVGSEITVNGNINLYAQWQLSGSYLFYESFDTNNGTGGNDSQWSGTIASNTLQSDNEDWTFANGSGANRCAKFGTGSKLGSAQTPAIAHTGNATLTFKAAAWNGNSENTTLKLSATSGNLSASTVTLEKGAWTNYTIEIAGITTSTQIKFEGNAASNSRFFLDEVLVVEAEPSNEPSITADNVNIAYDAEEGTIVYTINNPVDGGSIVASCDAEWIEVDDTPQTTSTGSIDFICAPNSNFYAHSATVTLTYTYNDSKATITKDVTVTQALDPNANGSTSEYPITVSEAIEAIDEVGTVSNIYVGGIVSEIMASTSSYITFKMYDEVGNDYYLQAYHCTGNNFDEVAVGDQVVVYGTLEKYGTSVYQFASGCQLVSLIHAPSIIVESNVINVNAESHQDYLAITFENFEPTTGYAFTCDANGTFTDYSWLVAELDINNNRVRYTIGNNEEEARTGYFKVKCGDVYSEIVTVNQAAYEAPSLTGTITFGNATGSTNINSTSVTGEDSMGNTWTITTTFEGEESFTPQPGYAQVGASKKPATSIIFTTTLPVEAIVSAFEAKFGGFSGTAGDVTLSVDETTVGTGSLNETADVIVESTESETGTVLTVTVTNIAKGVKCYYISYTLEEEVTPTDPTITVTGYGDTDGGYVLIASPTVEYANPETIGMATGNYDLYYYDAEQNLEWRNYKAQDGGNYNLEPGKGYLYANQETVTITFTGDLNPSFSDVELPYTENDVIKSLYLAGNSSTQAQTFYVNDGNFDHQTFNYLTINEDGNGFISAQATSYTAPAMTGFFVQAPGEDMALSTYDINAKANVSLLNINVLRDRGSVIDNAIVSFSNGSMMDKFYLKNNTTRVYIPQGNREMAIANSAAEAEMPVNFRASENGTYTLAVEAENVEMNYLHLIDNLTGMDVDLLQTPSYTFEAKTSDYASRFRLVFKANSTNENNAEAFAYFNGTNWTVSNVGDATLQVVDVMGRVLSSETLKGNANISLNQVPGVYVLRLVSGNDVKVQKVVVR